MASMMGSYRNSRTEFYPGITNKLFKADAICVAYENLEQFSKRKNDFNGNPVRQDLIDVSKRELQWY
jgi:UDP-N-acetylglucosamine:LPS N-acetylglucosamine transferase